METSCTVFRRIPLSTGARFCLRRRYSSNCSFSSSQSSRVAVRRERAGLVSAEFRINSHVEYYSDSLSKRNSGVSSSLKFPESTDVDAKKLRRKKKKLLKALTKDLAELSDVVVELNHGSHIGVVGEVKGNIISEAAELLLAQLQSMKAEDKEVKRRKKEEKTAKKMAKNSRCEASSSSSSESSDSECDEVIDMKLLQNKIAKLPDVREDLILPLPAGCDPSPVDRIVPAEKGEMGNGLVGGETEKLIEVCMGGKCKKSGATTILEELQRSVGDDRAVVGCKCMGKCKDGPNVRVQGVKERDDGGLVNSGHGRSSTFSSLCIGVGLQDVGLIISSLLGDSSTENSIIPSPSH